MAPKGKKKSETEDGSKKVRSLEADLAQLSRRLEEEEERKNGDAKLIAELSERIEKLEGELAAARKIELPNGETVETPPAEGPQGKPPTRKREPKPSPEEGGPGWGFKI